MERNTRILGIALSIFASSLFSGCASVPPQNMKLDQAQAAYDAASHDSAMQQAAPEELRKASAALDQANALAGKGAPTADIDHFAYMAQQHVEIAKEKEASDEIQKKIDQAGARRDKLMLEAKQQKIAQLRDKLSALKAKKTNRGMVLTLGSVLFDLNKSTLKAGGEKNIQKLAQFMQIDSKRNVMIEGYTDSTGSVEYNDKLSEKRADAVREALVNDGISPQRIVTKGYGPKFPVSSNKTASGRQQNRRVEIVISDETGNFPRSR